MRREVALVLALPLVLLLLWPLVASPRAGLPSLNPTLTTSCPPYVGVGDIDSGALFYYGFRAYSQIAAKAQVKAAQLRRASDSTTLDIHVLCNGAFNVSAAATFCAATSCFISELYDQTGNGYDAPQPTMGSQAPYNASCISSLPCLNGTGSGTYLSTVTVGTHLNQPDTYWAVDLSATSPGFITVPLGCGNGLGNQRITAFAADAHAGNAGSDVQGAAGIFGVTDNLFVANAASSFYYFNGGTNSGNAGSNNCNSSDNVEIAHDGGVFEQFFEGAAWAGAKTGTDYTNLRANADGYWHY